jgi:D-xylose transport system ATP-binding protein
MTNYEKLTNRTLRQPVNTLSGGERQILAILCAIARRPKLLLLDEASEGLAGPIAARPGNQLRAQGARGVGTLVTDWLGGQLAAVADRVLQLSNGRFERVR